MSDLFGVEPPVKKRRSVRVVPSKERVEFAIGVARDRQEQSKVHPEKHGQARDPLAVHIEGAIGEMVVADYLGIEWDGNLGSYQAADVGRHQVRATRWVNGKLIVHPHESDDDRFVLVTQDSGREQAYMIRGWLFGRECKVPKWWADPTGQDRAAFFVPQEALRAMAAWDV